ncbi:MAG: radical SAM protein [Nanoarchaeota archaeon]
MDDITLVTTSAVNLGIRSISAYLKSHGHSARCVFLDQPETRIYEDRTLIGLERLCSDSQIVGVSGIQSTMHKTIQVISRLKRSDNTIIVGGYDSTLVPERYESADYICQGDGEKVMLDLVRRIEMRDAPTQRILPVVPVHDLNELPAEDYDCSSQFTISEEGGIVPLKRLLDYRNMRVNTKESLFYVASRGCPYRCTYCEEPRFMKIAGSKKPMRLKSPKKVIEDIGYIRSRHPEMERVYFVDAEFFSKPVDWIEEFSGSYREDISLPFWVFGHPAAVTGRKLALLVDAGLKELQMGIQSGSDKTRREDYQRNTPNEKIINTMKLIHQYGVLPSIDIIFDNPFENRDDLLQTINLLVELPKPFKLGSFGLEFLHGTPLAERARQEGLLDAESERNFNNRKVKRRENVYLNSLIRWMAGDCTTESLGIIPVSSVQYMTAPYIIDFMEDNPSFASTLDSIMRSYPELMYDRGMASQRNG